MSQATARAASVATVATDRARAALALRNDIAGMVHPDDRSLFEHTLAWVRQGRHRRATIRARVSQGPERWAEIRSAARTTAPATLAWSSPTPASA
jgi:hypothetical protein